ncbi:putative transcriptional regulator, GntR-family [Aurantimonas manganoxydans SI85-9A1]|uniref:Putative transcriptional regulator, GntR-family n=2 Tax=Aurantimonas manganoxydans TaxID=651183 RepID=Q1YHC6_AURMS|nr:GntR family transcriptional regulator [Aurantimonas manganoxydans]EAS49653.1 putative transcriptional regulator, GntR-family [Aurantimonas manganoxydans SI85-9A1]BAT29245.1 putative transcriptional regulator, GntR-family [Aurantimonas manganoxydans SI85-9A1]
MSRTAAPGNADEAYATTAAGRQSGEEASLEIAGQLEEDIVFGRLHPRERLIEEDISSRFQAKRHVVRQALIELERLGLVNRVRNRGAVVRLYSEAEVEDINAVRELLESHAASLIELPMSDDAIAELEAIQDRHSGAIEAEDRRGVFRSNIEFHQALFAHCGNAALIEAINSFAQKSHAYRSIFVNDRGYLLWAANAHREMIAAIRSQNRAELIALCRAHLAPAKNHYIEMFRTRFT